MEKANKSKRSFGQDLNQAWLGDEEFQKVKLAKEGSQDERSSTSHQVAEALEKSQSLRSAGIDLKQENIVIARGYVCYVFSPKTHEFSRISDMLRDRSYFETIYVNKKLYAISTFSVVASGSVEYYDFGKSPVTKWVHAKMLPKKLRSIGATLSNDNKIIVTGGIDMDTLTRTDEVIEGHIDEQDASQILWKTKVSKLLTPRFRHAAITMSNGDILVAGGILNIHGHDIFTATTEIYDQKKDVWTNGPSMIIQRAIDLKLMTIQDTVYVVGGDVMMPSYESEGGPIIGSIERLNKSTNTWEIVTNFPSERRGIAACALGRVIYIFGGRAGTTDLSTWDAYDVVASKWLSQELKKELTMPPEIECLYGNAQAMPAIHD